MKTDTEQSPPAAGQILKKSANDAATIGLGAPAWVTVDQGGTVVAVDRGLLERCAERDPVARLVLGVLNCVSHRHFGIPQTCPVSAVPHGASHRPRPGAHSCALGEYPPPPGSHVHRLNFGEDD